MSASYTKRAAAPADPMAAALRMTPLSPSTQAHLQAVYTTLATSVAAAAVGAALQQRLGNMPLSTLLPSLLSLAATLYFVTLPRNAPGRRSALHAAAAASGAATGPLLSVAAAVDPRMATVAFVATAGVFGCLSAAAALSPRRAWVYLGGMLGAAVGGLAIIGLLNMFVGSVGLWGLQIYGGLMVFCGYVVYDSQLIVERAEAGDKDVVGHAFELFTDLAAIFKRLLIIMIRNQTQRKQREDEERRRR
jgi:Bax inhibitor 1